MTRANIDVESMYRRLNLEREFEQMVKKMTVKKKATKKATTTKAKATYAMTRSQIAERLSELGDKFNDIDTRSMSPDDVADALGELSADVGDLATQVEEKTDDLCDGGYCF